MIYDGVRIDDNPMHDALREALANCLISTDYYGSRGVVITLHFNRITIANPGYSRTGKIQMMLGGISDPRNRGLMKMFNLIDMREAFDIYYSSKLAGQIANSNYGIENLSAKHLVEDLIENESELLNK